jgi:predicted nucleic acid-binding protein
MYVLDTDVVSHLRRPDRADPNVIAWASSTPVTLHFISSITLHEIERGILSMERKDPAQGAVLRAWVDGQILTQFAGRILPIDVAVAQRCAKLHVPDPRPERDAFIAATALVHGMTIVSRNVADFRPTGVEVLDPWEWQAASDTLHLEIEAILRNAGNKWMMSSEIAREVNRRGSYARKDTTAVPAKQIAARVDNYPHLCESRGARSSRQYRLKRSL